jgi:hypothetical protein
MKKSNILRVLILTAAMVFICIPAAVFAGSGDSATFEFKGEAHYHMGQKWADIKNEGNSITISYPDKAPETYILKGYDEYGDGIIYYNYFLNGEVAKYPSGKYKYVSLEVDDYEAVYDGPETDIAAHVWGPLAEDGEGDWGLMATGYIHATAYPKPVSLRYEGADLMYVAGYTYVDNFFQPGNKIIVSCHDGTEMTYIRKEFYDGEDYLGGGYYLDGVVPLKENGEPDYWSGGHFELDSPDDGFAAGTTKTTITFRTEYGAEDIYIKGEVPLELIPSIESIEYKGKPLYYYNDSHQLDNFEVPGNLILAHLDNGKTADYIYTQYEVKDEDGYEYTDGHYFLDGKVTLDENGDPKNVIYPNAFYIDNDQAKICLGDEDSRIYVKVPAVKAPKPVRLEYEGGVLHFHPGDNYIDDLYTENNKITVIFDDGSRKEFICKEFVDDGLNRQGFFLDGEVYFNGLYYETTEFETESPGDGFKAGTRKATVSCNWYYGYDDMTVKGTFPVEPAPAPASIEFIPGVEGFVAEGLIGKTSSDERNFYGEGNKFIVRYVDGSSKEYIYQPDSDFAMGGFLLNGNYYESNFGMHCDLYNGVKRGTNNVTYKYDETVEVDGKAKKVVVKFTAPLKATKKFVYLEFPKGATYTGKVLRPAGKLYLYNGTALSSKYFTIDYREEGIEIGSYEAHPVIKEAYAATYGTDDDSRSYYKIVPKGTTFSKVTGGKRSFTASWKKQTNRTSGYQIQYATNSKFTKGKKLITITKNSTTKRVVKSLKAKKTYYVRVRTYKIVDGEKYYSAWSKYKKVTTR